MIVNFAILAKSPGQCSAAELACFTQLVEQGGEVSKRGLLARIASAHLLAFCSNHADVLGVAALKQPARSHRAKIIRDTGVDLDEARWPFELGWVYVVEAARHRGISTRLVTALLQEVRGKGVFATIRASNEGIRTVLERANFRCAGRRYMSTRGKGELQLLTRLP